MKRVFTERQQAARAYLHLLLALVGGWSGVAPLWVARPDVASVTFFGLCALWFVLQAQSAVRCLRDDGRVLFEVECMGSAVRWHTRRGPVEVDLRELRALRLARGEDAIRFELREGGTLELAGVPFSRYRELFDYLRDHFDGPARLGDELLGERPARLLGRYS